MRQHWAKRQFEWRLALIACGLAILLALQTLASPLAAAASVNRHDSPAIGLSFNEICDSDPGAPGKKHIAHQDCCVLCQSNTRDAATFILALLVATATFDPAREATAPTYPQTQARPPRVVGWASSWSSRAPPSFS
jgi:hypothetical protein